MKILKFAHQSLSVTSYLPDAVLSGTSSVTVYDGTQFAVNDFILIGDIGTENDFAKILSITGNVITIDRFLKYSYNIPNATPIQKVPYDVFDIYRSIDEGVTYSIYSKTNSIDFLNPYVIFELNEAEDAYYKIAYRNSLLSATASLFDSFSVGVGDRMNFDSPVGSGDFSALKNITGILQDNAVTSDMSRYIAIWITPGWNETWFPATDVQTNIIDKGFIPVFIHWYFGDDTRPATVTAAETAYYADLTNVGTYLAKLNGTVLFVLEPEYNTPYLGDESIKTWTGFNTVLLNGRQSVETAIDAAYAIALQPRATNVFYGVAPGSWDTAATLQPSMGTFTALADFVGIEFIHASTSPYTTQVDALASAQHSLDLLKEYWALYSKPTIITNFAISTYDTVISTGWDATQVAVMNSFLSLRDQFINDAHTFGILYMMLTDDPSHTGFYGEAEYHFGIMSSTFIKKASFDVFFSIQSTPIPTQGTSTSIYGDVLKSINYNHVFVTLNDLLAQNIVDIYGYTDYEKYLAIEYACAMIRNYIGYDPVYQLVIDDQCRTISSQTWLTYIKTKVLPVVSLYEINGSVVTPVLKYPSNVSIDIATNLMQFMRDSVKVVGMNGPSISLIQQAGTIGSFNYDAIPSPAYDYAQYNNQSPICIMSYYGGYEVVPDEFIHAALYFMRMYFDVNTSDNSFDKGIKKKKHYNRAIEFSSSVTNITDSKMYNMAVQLLKKYKRLFF